MKKDHLRDYATAAFRYYAKIGKTSEQVKEDIGNMLMDAREERIINTGGTGSPTEHAIMEKERVINELKAEIDDLEAVEKTLELLKRRFDYGTIKAIEIVYFTDPNKPLEKNDLSSRVVKAAAEIPCGEATVYRMLSKARRVFAEERGLRSNWEKTEEKASI